MSSFGYWTFKGKNGLTGAPSTVNTLPDGRKILVKDPDFPAVLEDDFILFALKNSRVARSQFNGLYPKLDEISKSRLNALLAKNGGVKKSLNNPLFGQSAQDKSDLIQSNQVGETRRSQNGSNSYLETPRKNRDPRSYPTPSAPSNLVAVAGNGFATLTFDSNSSPITNHQYSLDGGATWTSADGANSPLTIRPLVNERTYSIQIRPLNLAGPGDSSSAVSVTPTATPGQPTIDAVSPGDGQLVVAFTAASDGGSAITDYEYTVDGGLNYVSSGTTSSPLTVLGLTNGTSYPVQIRALNTNGPGDPSDAVSATPSTVPSQPTISGITTGDEELLVSVTGSDGGSAITDYEYSLNGGAFASAGNSSPFSITGLTNGTSYDVVVQAVNANGTSAPSATSTAVPSTVPGPPTIGVILTGNESLTLPISIVDTGGVPLIPPVFEYRLDGGSFAPFPSVGPSGYVITGLTNGIEYSVEVRAINSNGAGTISAPATATPSTGPDAPVITSITGGDQSLSINYTPGFDGGSPITGYQIRLDSGPYTPAVNYPNPAVIGPLVNGTPYDVEMRAVNANGVSVASNLVVGTPSA